METLGQKLKAARLARKMTASEAAKGTRIKVQHIEAMEGDDFSAIPAPAYAKGFIKLYAELLGLDPAPLIAEYIDRHAPTGRASLMSDPAAQEQSRPVRAWPRPDWRKWGGVLQRALATVTVYYRHWLEERRAARSAPELPESKPTESSANELLPPPAIEPVQEPGDLAPPSPQPRKRMVLAAYIAGGLLFVAFLLIVQRRGTLPAGPEPGEPVVEQPTAAPPPRAPLPPPGDGVLPLLDTLPDPYLDRDRTP